MTQTFEISNFGHWDLFVIWNFWFGIFQIDAQKFFIRSNWMLTARGGADPERTVNPEPLNLLSKIPNKYPIVGDETIIKLNYGSMCPLYWSKTNHSTSRGPKQCNLNPPENPAISVHRQRTASTSRDYWMWVGPSDLPAWISRQLKGKTGPLWQHWAADWRIRLNCSGYWIRCIIWGQR